MWNAVQQWTIWLMFRPLALIVWTVSHVCSCFYGKPAIPPISNQLLLYSATDLAKMIRERKVTCKEVIEAYISRVKEVNPTLNAVVQERFDQALQEARDLDLRLANSNKSVFDLARDTPLLGVPLTVKESIPVKGLSNNAGVPGRIRVAEEDAITVATLRSRGVIPLLVSNTPELCLSWETDNPVTGRTNNPFNPRRTSGGSSGGEGALLGSGASLIGLGSDIGGSGRIPASFCGVFGHKPSSGYIDVQGHMPSSDDPMWKSVFLYAPMARYAVDLPLLYAASVTDQKKLAQLRLEESVDLKSLKFFYMVNDASVMSSNCNREVKAALHKAITHIEQTFKLPVKEVHFDEYKHASQVSFVLLLRMLPPHSIFQKSEDNLTDWKSVFWQSVRWMLGLSPHALHAVVYGIVKRYVDTYSARQIQQLEDCKQVIIEKLVEHLGDDGVLLFPTFPEPAHRHMQIYYRQLNAPYLSLFNLIDMPSTACPIAFSSSGLPIGIQVIASRGQDRLTLAVAQELERAFGGWTPPTGTNLLSINHPQHNQCDLPQWTNPGAIGEGEIGSVSA